MTSSQLTKSVLALPEPERLELARRIVASIATEKQQAALLAAGVKRLEAVVSGQINGLTEREFRQALR
ncbi:hypothetical protein [Opitutus sp. GAS368]|jgi:hypothetical protein|uniref:hypothetical protein n=1 Tax=Opitutus sp. GAS368 TaxID=1882749 RepID=UPI00087927F3|nr:hypothetical protein [Opitutus sp. GAS368]SDR66934.1 hypothetical protein SAMN05444173_0250 [Opitutus sp. GAS368]